MARMTVNINEGLLVEAQRALGTHGVTETINAAMTAVVQRSALDDFSLAEFDITDDDLAKARQQRGRA